MLPFLAIAAAGMQAAGGIVQAGEIRRQTEERLRALRIERAQQVGAYTAAVGGTGVEYTSATVQNHLNRMNQEFDRAQAETSRAGGTSALYAMMGGIGAGAATFGKGMYEAGKVTDALGEAPQKPPAFAESLAERDPELYWGR